MDDEKRSEGTGRRSGGSRGQEQRDYGPLRDPREARGQSGQWRGQFGRSSGRYVQPNGSVDRHVTSNQHRGEGNDDDVEPGGFWFWAPIMAVALSMTGFALLFLWH